MYFRVTKEAQSRFRCAFAASLRSSRSVATTTAPWASARVAEEEGVAGKTLKAISTAATAATLEASRGREGVTHAMGVGRSLRRKGRWWKYQTKNW